LKKNKKRLKNLWYLYFLIVSITFFNITTSSKFLSNVKIDSTLTTAKPIIEITASQEELNEINNIRKEISFLVKNFETVDGVNNIINECALNYNLSISLANNTPIQYNLYKIINSQRQLVNLNNNTTENMLMSHSNEQIDEYVLELYIDNVSYKNSYDQLNILLFAEQV